MKEFLKTILAGLFVLTCVISVFASFDKIFNVEKWSPLVLGIILTVVFFGAMFVAIVIFNYKKSNVKNQGMGIEELEKAGLVQRERYSAVRAFQVEEWEDEGSQYFVELDDKRVLFLCGQYLYEYEPADYEQPPVPRRFPCVEFEVFRHRSTKNALDIVCHGAVIEPEFTAPPFTEEEHEKNQVPKDGNIIPNRSYDEIKIWMTQSNQG